MYERGTEKQDILELEASSDQNANKIHKRKNGRYRGSIMQVAVANGYKTKKRDTFWNRSILVWPRSMFIFTKLWKNKNGTSSSSKVSIIENAITDLMIEFNTHEKNAARFFV